MAIFDATLIGGSGPTGKYKAFCETKDDLKSPVLEPWAEGSAVVCLNLNVDATGQSPTVHIKLPNGKMSGIEEVDAEEEETNGQ